MWLTSETILHNTLPLGGW